MPLTLSAPVCWQLEYIPCLDKCKTVWNDCAHFELSRFPGLSSHVFLKYSFKFLQRQNDATNRLLCDILGVYLFYMRPRHLAETFFCMCSEKQIQTLVLQIAAYIELRRPDGVLSKYKETGISIDPDTLQKKNQIRSASLWPSGRDH